MIETRHVKLEYEEGLLAKKELLSAELNLLHTVKRLRNYRILRKKEIATKNKLRASLASLRTKLNNIQLTFPQEEGKIKKIKSRKTAIEKRDNKNIQKELKDIQDKLEKLR